jgi:hypothetical protein
MHCFIVLENINYEFLNVLKYVLYSFNYLKLIQMLSWYIKKGTPQI